MLTDTDVKHVILLRNIMRQLLIKLCKSTQWIHIYYCVHNFHPPAPGGGKIEATLTDSEKKIGDRWSKIPYSTILLFLLIDNDDDW